MMKQSYDLPQHDEAMESLSASKAIQTEIIQLLEQNNCTVRESKYILSQVSRYIDSFSAVQFNGMPDYEM